MPFPPPLAAAGDHPSRPVSPTDVHLTNLPIPVNLPLEKVGSSEFPALF
ncbi:MAG: hypothetical protein ACREJ2_04095 [Planctomycetota bacterium]